MSLYAATARKRNAQVLVDVLIVLWAAFCVWLALTVHDSISGLAEPGERTASSATSLGEALDGAGDFLSGVPLVGDGVAGPFDRAADASARIAEAGTATAEAVERAAFWLAFTIIVVPIGLAGSRWLPWRVRFVRESAAGRRLLDGRADIELFAHRALAHQPLRRLAQVHPDPVGAVRRREWAVIHALADLELRDHGLRVPVPSGGGWGSAPPGPPPPGGYR